MIFTIPADVKSGIKPAPACHRPYCTMVVCFEQYLKDQQCDKCYHQGYSIVLQGLYGYS